MNITLVIVNVIAALVVLLYGVLFVANSMSHKTSFLVRASWVFLSTGAFAISVGPLFGVAQYSMGATCMNLGLAVFILGNRRSEHGKV
jgi:hypothetical protein